MSNPINEPCTEPNSKPNSEISEIDKANNKKTKSNTVDSTIVSAVDSDINFVLFEDKSKETMITDSISQTNTLEEGISFPTKDNKYLDNNLASINQEIVSVVTSKSKVNTGKNTTTYSTIVIEKGIIGKKLNQKYSTGIKRFKTFLNYPLEGFGRKASLWICILLCILVIFSGIFMIFLGDIWANSPNLEQFMKRPSESSVVYARDGKTKIYEYYKEERRELISITKIPKVMQLAVIALEDENFYRNEQGIPWKNIVGAMQKCVSSGGESCRGGSGLTQQLVKVMTKNQEVSTTRKIRELVSAIKLNQDSNHTDILEAYLNWVSFGRNSYGIEQAAKSFYGKSVSEKDSRGEYTLNPAEACFLASLIQSPGYYPSGIGKPETDAYKSLVIRKNLCLNKLNDLDLPIDNSGTLGKYVSSLADLKKWQNMDTDLVDYKDAETERQKNKVVFIKPRTDDPFPHFRAYLTEELIKMYGEQTVYNGGLKVVTTLDPNTQVKTQNIIKDSESKLNYAGANNAGGLILDGPTGEIIAMVGSIDYNREDIDGQVNMTTTPRQPGSSIKPYVYASAYQNGFNPGTVLLDAPINFGKFEPLNFDKKFYGPITAREAMQNSLNIPAVKSLYLSATPNNYPNGQSGLDNLKVFTDKTGLDFPYFDQGTCGVATALGGCEVRMIDHATGINTLLQEGKKSTATPFLEISTKEKDFITGKESTQDLYNLVTNSQNNPYPQENGAIDPGVARQTANVMSDTESRYKSIWGSSAQYLTLPDWSSVGGIAAKTGTTSDVKDMWVVGGSPYYTVLVWNGNTDNKPMSQKASSSGVTGKIWQEIMKKVHTGKDKKNFSKEGLIPTALNPATGLLQEGGKLELLTSKQVDKLKEVQAKINSGQVDYNNGSIFTNRTSVFGSKIKVNKIDKKLIPDNDQGKAWPPQLTEEIFCQVSISEFPLAENWKKGSGGNGKDCPFEVSTLDINANKMNFEINFSTGQKAPDSLSILIKPPVPETKIKSIEIKIGGQYVGSIQDTNNVQQDVRNINGVKDVEITVRDETGQETKVDYPNIIFGNTSPSTTLSSCGINGAVITIGQGCPTIPTSQPTSQLAPTIFQIKP